MIKALRNEIISGSACCLNVYQLVAEIMCLCIYFYLLLFHLSIHFNVKLFINVFSFVVIFVFGLLFLYFTLLYNVIELICSS